MQAPICTATKKPCLSNRIAAIWMLAALTLMLVAPTSLVNDAVQLAVLPMGALALMALFDPSFCLHRLFLGPQRKERLLALLFTALYFLLLSVPNLFQCPLFSEKGLSTIWWRYRLVRLIYLVWNWTGFLLGYLLAVYACIHRAFSAALMPRDPADKPLTIGPKLRWIGLYPESLAFALVLGCIAFSSAPSLFIGDAPTVWYGVRDSLWDEWHTAGYMLFVKLLSAVWNSQRCVVLVQTVACLYIHNDALTRLGDAGCSRRTCRAYLLAAAISFVPLYFLQAILKDVVFSLSLFAFTLGLLRLLHTAKPRIADFVWTGFFALCACLFRHAGALPVACAALVLAVRLIKQKSKALPGFLATCACVIACNVLIVNVLAYRVMDFRRNPSYIVMSAPMTMIGAVAASGEPLSEEDTAVMERVMPVEKWAACYNRYFADSISRPYGAIGDDVEQVVRQNLSGELIRLNARFLLRYPKVYLKAFFDLNSLAWEIATPSDGYVRSYLGYPVTPIADFVAAQGFDADGVDPVSKELKQAEDTTFTALAPLVNRYAELLCGLPVTRCLFWRGGFANLVLLACAAVLIKKRRAADLIALVPIAVLTAGLLFSMPAQEVRYIFPNLYCAGFFAAYAWGCRKA